MDKLMKIGYWETFNRDSNMIERSNSRMMQGIALYGGVIIAIMSIIPYFGITIGDSLPMVITLLGYSLGGSVWNKTIELSTGSKKGGDK
jgi:hypothetical protein